jgi:hypothetical protein
MVIQFSVVEVVYISHDADDFDGDGITNASDSCPATTNTGVDEDQDGIDDACDGQITTPEQTVRAETLQTVGLSSHNGRLRVISGSKIGLETMVSSTATGNKTQNTTSSQVAVWHKIHTFLWYVWLASFVATVGFAYLCRHLATRGIIASRRQAS